MTVFFFFWGGGWGGGEMYDEGCSPCCLEKKNEI
jgi:hypothetical protein